MHEEPLHLIPGGAARRLQEAVRRPYRGRSLPGLPLPAATTSGSGNIDNVPDTAHHPFRARRACGIGTFKPADPKSQDVAELTGSVNIQALTEFGQESDPRAYNFDGELNIANRGVMEFIEMLKAEKRFLYELNTVAGEQTIKASRGSPSSTADLAVIAHTNEYEYNSYFGNKENEAMIDRIFVVRVPLQPQAVTKRCESTRS